MIAEGAHAIARRAWPWFFAGALVATRARAHHGVVVAAQVDVGASGLVAVRHLEGPRELVAVTLPPSCRALDDAHPGPSFSFADGRAVLARCDRGFERDPLIVTGLGTGASALVVRFTGAATGATTVYPERPTFAIPRHGAPSFDPGGAVRAGAGHVARGLDHLALVALLVVAARGFLDAVVPLLGFTVAHALTLGLAAFGHPLLPGRLAEVLVAASLVLATRLRAEEPTRTRAGAAFAFGLVHGVAFLEGAAPLLANGDAPLRTLLFFHVGIEAVQVGVAGALAAAIASIEVRSGHGGAARSALATIAGAYGVALFLARLT